MNLSQLGNRLGRQWVGGGHRHKDYFACGYRFAPEYYFALGYRFASGYRFAPGHSLGQKNCLEGRNYRETEGLLGTEILLGIERSNGSDKPGSAIARSRWLESIAYSGLGCGGIGSIDHYRSLELLDLAILSGFLCVILGERGATDAGGGRAGNSIAGIAHWSYCSSSYHLNCHGLNCHGLNWNWWRGSSPFVPER
jgi:hypothetical protein